MKPADPTGGGPLPPAPPARDLPHHDPHRRELLAIVRSEHGGGRRWPAAWLAPLGAALAVLVIVAGVFVLPGLLGGSRSGGPGPSTGPASPGRPAASGTRHGPLIRRTVSYLERSTVSGLVLQASVGDVNITGANRSTVAITAHLNYRGSAPVVTRQLTHGLLHLGYRCPSGDCGVSFDLTVPRALAVTVRWGTGDIGLDGLTSDVLVHLGTGQIQASDMSGAMIRLSTRAGMISVGCTASPRLLIASSGVGSLSVRVPVTVPYLVTAKTQVGSVRVTVPRAAGSGHKIVAFTGAGTVAVTGN